MVHLASLTLSAILVAQSTPSSSKAPWSYNFSGSPMVITTIGTTIFNVKNASTRLITTYQLGCVAVGNSAAPRITLRMPPISRQLKPGESVEEIADHNLPEKVSCDQKKSKLTVIRVEWANEEWDAIPGESFSDHEISSIVPVE